MGIGIAYFIYALTLVLHAIAFILILEWAVHWLPGAFWNPLRRALFRFSYPFLKAGEIFGVRWGNFDATPLVAAALLLLVTRWGLPWLVLLSYSLRGS